jgi:hypothetical protein
MLVSSRRVSSLAGGLRMKAAEIQVFPLLQAACTREGRFGIHRYKERQRGTGRQGRIVALPAAWLYCQPDHHDLQAETEQGSFSAPLLYRCSVLALAASRPCSDGIGDALYLIISHRTTLFRGRG